MPRAYRKHDAAAQPVEEPRRRRRQRGAQRPEEQVAVSHGLLAHGVLDGGARLAQRKGLGVDGQRGLVAEEVPGHGREDEGQVGMRLRDGDHVEGGGEAGLAVGGDHDGRRLVGAVDRHLLGDVVGG
jgi:hypothetical protein